ncbi:hypothetical protein TUMSATVNIG1_23490 [Vibrio nigripulchritudo]|uniref:hypothetical protein n=1 Tax=Vibrio nigripulchritudo TaxID=28173 RepID=UPI00190CC3C6|nr:hypothetical protein [Vibrio nigripulchritudo]BCL70388.1 hypothetical protein VNTUMSATTG_23250 [Vibrio nigripulchritudo]BDU31740.1 hypothetical protein TUMSATVNIG1_23490 [Vibrio nigripulchritudo]
MSNIAGKAYAMNVVTPIKWYWRWLNKFIFWAVNSNAMSLVGASLNGLLTLSLIHYARWAIVKPSEFPRLSEDQPKETIKYSYMFFFSNFNGSWAQYVDSFHSSIPSGLNLFWYKNVKYPGSVPLQPFHDYITYNQVWTNHYYSAYPMAASNDVKSGQQVRDSLSDFIKGTPANETADDFKKRYEALTLDLQDHIGMMAPAPIVSLSADAVEKRLAQAS